MTFQTYALKNFQWVQTMRYLRYLKHGIPELYLVSKNLDVRSKPTWRMRKVKYVPWTQHLPMSKETLFVGVLRHVSAATLEIKNNGQMVKSIFNRPIIHVSLSLYPTVFLHFYSAMQPPQMAGHVEPVLSLANWIRIWPCPAAGFKCIYYIVGSNLKNQVSTYYGICWTPISWHICWLDPRLRHGLVLAQRPSGERCRS